MTKNSAITEKTKVRKLPPHLWKKGESGNPSGRPVNTLQHFLRDKKNLPQEIFAVIYPLLKSDDEKIVLEAATFLRDTRDGKPSQSVLLGGDADNPLPYSISVNFKQ